MAEDREAEEPQVTDVIAVTFYDDETGAEITTLPSAGYGSGEWAKKHGLMILTWDSNGVFSLS